MAEKKYKLGGYHGTLSSDKDAEIVGTELIRVWDRGNILSEYPWKSFEQQVKKAGYTMFDFHKGNVEERHGYWL